MTNQNFPEDFEREAQKDFVYLYEEQQMIMKEIIAEENKLPAKIYVFMELPKPIQDENKVEHNTLPF